MDLTRSFIEKIEEMGKPDVIWVEEVPFSKDELRKIYPPVPTAMGAQSLTAVIDYLKSNVDTLDEKELIVQVIDSETVKVVSALDLCYRIREYYIQANALLPTVILNKFMEREAFNIMLQSRFVENDDRERVLASIGKMRYENSLRLEDDGVTQTVASKVGVALVKEEQIPNPVYLAPFRTFTEVAQPVSPFILRVNDDCEVGLFEADGGAWRNAAMIRIKEYLSDQLGEGYTIIA